MSLFVGNLPPRIRADDLQRVFGRFGQCVLRLKGSFGFVVYEFPQDAEKALRALQGRYICGAPLTLMWSKKQPIPRQGRQRVVSSYALHGKDSARGRESACRRVSSNDRRGYRVDVMQHDTDGEKLNSDEGRGEPQKYAEDDSREHRDLGEGLLVDGVTNAAELVDTGNQIDDVVDFDRYEPCRSHEGEDGHGNHQMAYSGCGSVPQRPQEIARTVKISDTTLNCFNDLKSRNSCFSCGGLGHKKRDCPSKYSSRRNPTRFDHRKDDALVKSSRGEAELERCRSVSWEKLQLNKDSASRCMKSERASDTGKSRMLLNNGRSSVTVTEETDRSEVQVRGGKKRSKWEGKSPNRHRAKKARSRLLPPHSDYPASKSCAASKSSESLSRCSNSRARSKSVSMRAQSMPSDSRSGSKSISSKSRSRSRSFTSSSESLSVSSYTAHVGNDAPRVQTPGSHAAVCMSPEGSKEKFTPENSGGLMMGLTQLKKPASEKHVNYCNDRSTSISSEEMCMVLKLYGMELPAESERHLAIEEYLGSARLWPWEIIYYRRLKKGLVSVENYAKRVSQNQEFGITDKYVRSSSGWGEIDQENP